MAEPSLALQKSLLAALSGLSCEVYDGVPQNAAFPYVTLDGDLSTQVNALVERKSEHYPTLTVWSQARGKEEVLRIIGEIDAAVDGASLTLDTGRAVHVKVESTSTRRDADNVTFGGTVTLRIITEH